MNQHIKEKTTLYSLILGFVKAFIPVLKSKYFYFSAIILATGLGLNFASQTYLHNYISSGNTLPMLSDLILDNLRYVDVSLIYDIVALIPIVLTVIYFFHKKAIKRLPFFFLMIGIFYIVRGIFIVLTPFGNPPMFNGSDPLFHGFANYELGVYPSGHAGFVCMLLLLLSGEKVYKWIIRTCLVIVIIALFFAHGHYSIDILSGIFFSYAIKSYGDKHFYMFDLEYESRDNIVKGVQ
jgi:hypothetical protein